MQLEYLNLWWHGHADLPLETQLSWLEGHRLTALFTHRARLADWILPVTLRDAGRRARYQTAAQQSLASRQLTELGELARQLDIPIISVKGLAIAQAYPNTALRPANDIDLLVPESTVTTLLKALKTNGYTLTVTGRRGSHLPPLYPPGAGLRIEVHTALIRAHGAAQFTYEEWQENLIPWETFPGLWLPDPTRHWVYLVAHAFISHSLDTGLLPLADLKFWTAAWDFSTWQQCAGEAAARKLSHAGGLALALSAWFWNEPWPDEITTLFPSPPPSLLNMVQDMIIGEMIRNLPPVWRDLAAQDWRSWLSYINTVLWGDPAVRVGLSPTEKLLFFLRRPSALLQEHGTKVWNLLLRRPKNTHHAWNAQQELQTWLARR